MFSTQWSNFAINRSCWAKAVSCCWRAAGFSVAARHGHSKSLSISAILKGFINGAFAHSFAYDTEEGAVQGLLGGKKCGLVTISDEPLRVLAGSGKWNAVKILQNTRIFRSTRLCPGMPRSPLK